MSGFLPVGVQDFLHGWQPGMCQGIDTHNSGCNFFAGQNAPDESANGLNIADYRWQADLHRFELNGKRILLDVNSGSIHILDAAAWDLLRTLESTSGDAALAFSRLRGRYSGRQLAEVAAELEGLARRGVLFTRGDAENWEKDYGSPVIKSLCLHVAHRCNMRCSYCFAGDGSFGGEKELMPAKVGEAAIDFLLDSSGNRRHLEVDFFGGEPLLNFEVVRHITLYGNEKARERGKRIKFTLTTNCLLLDEEIEAFLNENEMQVVLSLDGRRETNDRVRHLVDGRGSYDYIVPRILRFTEGRNHQDYYVRGTYTPANLDFSADVLHLFDLGLRHLSLEPVSVPNGEFRFSDADMVLLEREYENLVEELVERMNAGAGIDFFHFNIDLSGGTCVPKKIKGCGAGFEYAAVDPEGYLYPCHQFVGMQDFLLGRVESGIENRRFSSQFRSANIFKKEECSRCWARFFCSGGCHAGAYKYSGSLLKPDPVACRLQKKRIECGIYFQLAKLEDSPGLE